MEGNPESLRRRRMGTTSRYMPPDDIIVNIFSRLPVKSLMRFRCVCKSWHALVSDPNFIDLHLNRTRATNNGYLLIKHRSVNSAGLNLSFHCDETFVEHTRLELPFMRSSLESFKVEGNCNGLLCLSCPVTPNSKRHIYLWNPAIHKFKALPNPLLHRDVFNYMFLTFSFVPQINDYRVVKFVYDRYFLENFPRGGYRLKVCPKVEIYSLRSNSWKEIQKVVPCEIHSSSIDPIVNGVVHWVACMKMGKNRFYEFILSFDMANEVFGKIKLPDCCRDDSVLDKSATLLKESLSLFVYSYEGLKERVDIWVMKEYGAAESWTKQFTFDRWVNFLSPLGFMKNGEVVLKGDDGELVSYDPEVQQVKDLRNCGVPGSLDVVTYYTESLILLNEGN